MSKSVSFQQRNTNILKVIGVIGLCALLSYWIFGRIKGPTPLIDGIMSRQSPAQAKARFDAEMEWKTIEDSGLKPGDKRPRFDVLTIASPYDYRSISGELTLKFFNDELMSTTFVPTKQADSSKLKAAAPDAYQSGGLTEGIYLKWQDERLEQEVNSWVMAYA